MHRPAIHYCSDLLYVTAHVMCLFCVATWNEGRDIRSDLVALATRYIEIHAMCVDFNMYILDIIIVIFHCCSLSLCPLKRTFQAAQHTIRQNTYDE